jgi:hypothetical protein
MKTDPNEKISTSHVGYEYHQNGDGIAWTTHEGGLTKREYFAAKAMQGIIASFNSPIQKEDPDYIASLSVKVSDALIEALNFDELNKTQEGK